MAIRRKAGHTSTIMSKITGIAGSITAALVLAGLSTLADLIWALWIPTHRMVFGLIHGALLFMCMGIVLGILAGHGRPGPGTTAGVVGKAAGGELLVGLVGAGSFYLLFPWAGWTAMFIAWMIVWILTAFLNRSIRGSSESTGVTLGRGLAAAGLSGIAFWAISGIWLSPSPGGPNYLVNFGSWFVAFLPGFASLLIGPGSPLPEEPADRAAG